MAAIGNPGAFGKRGTFALVAIAILAFVAFLYLAGQGGLSGSANNGRAHAAGNGLAGFAGLTRLLEADGTPVVLSRDQAALDSPGLLVLTPPEEVDTEELARIVDRRRTIGPTMIVAPKWFAIPLGDAADQPGWVALMGASEGWSIEIDGQSYEFTGDRELKRAPRWQGRSLRGRLPSEDAVLHFDPDSADGQIAPLVSDGKGRMLAGYLADDGSFLDGDLYLAPDSGDGRPVFGVMLVAEPDLINNWGLADRTRAALALDLVALARQGTEDPVRFDVTLNGLGNSRNLLTLAFEPPFLAATLTLLLALAIAMWRAFNRFGPALRPAPAIRPGKSQLVANGAQVIGRSGRLHLLRDPYANLVGARATRRLGLRERQDQSAEAALHERGEDDLAHAITALRKARGRNETLRAARALRESERTTQQ
tara:strand:- start:196 stop:1467 length:1272 start_codon:yes stop_codon:yes gene_type:complete